jgi:hypothetical protein
MEVTAGIAARFVRLPLRGSPLASGKVASCDFAEPWRCCNCDTAATN